MEVPVELMFLIFFLQFHNELVSTKNKIIASPPWSGMAFHVFFSSSTTHLICFYITDTAQLLCIALTIMLVIKCNKTSKKDLFM